MDEEAFLAKMIEWLKAKREEYNFESTAWHVLDGLVDDAREAYRTGVMPWEFSDGD